MVKVGDTVVSVYDACADITIGNEYVVTAVYGSCFTFRDDGGCERTRLLRDYRVIPSAPPHKIQQDGYEYKLVGPVKPDWLVDGAWVVDKYSKEKYHIIEGEPGNYRLLRSGSNHLDRDIGWIESFTRPHTASDWKWGDWAMYEGKRVFVIGRVECTGMIGVSSLNIDRYGDDEYDKNYAFIRPSELTPTF